MRRADRRFDDDADVMDPTPLSDPARRAAVARGLATAGWLFAMAGWPRAARAATVSTVFDGWTRFDTPGHGAAVRHPRPGLLLMGGAGGHDSAFRWLADRAGGGRLLILASRGGAWRAEWLSERDAGFSSYVTAVTASRLASSDPALLDAVQEADAVLMSGGAQGTYLDLWRDTPLQAGLQRHVMAGKPLAGLSAGLAMMGEWCFSASRGSLSTARVLDDPFDEAVTIEPGLLRLPDMAGLLTDSHFSQRRRLGRLAGFLVHLRCLRRVDAVGLGVDERTSLAIADGMAEVLSDPGGGVHRVAVHAPPRACGDWPAARAALRVEVVTATAGMRVPWPWPGEGARQVDPLA